MTRTRHVRLGLVAVGALLVLLVAIQPGHSQLRPPGVYSPPGGGGVAGDFRPQPQPGFPEMPRVPEYRPPAYRPPDFTPPTPTMPPGIGSRPGVGGPAIYDYSCSVCGRHLSTGFAPPAFTRCPYCGSHLRGSATGGPGGVDTPPMAPVVPPIIDAPILPPVPVDPPNPGFSGGVYVPPATEPAPARGVSFGTRMLLITLGVLVLLGIGITAVVIVLLKQQPAARPAPRRRPRRYDDD